MPARLWKWEMRTSGLFVLQFLLQLRRKLADIMDVLGLNVERTHARASFWLNVTNAALILGSSASIQIYLFTLQ